VIRAILAAMLAALAVAMPAGGQELPPDGIDVGGSVPSFLALSLADRSGSVIEARVTATDAPTALSVGDVPLARWTEPVANKTVDVRSHGKELWITLSAETP
jgi:hypothetical protein